MSAKENFFKFLETAANLAHLTRKDEIEPVDNPGSLLNPGDERLFREVQKARKSVFTVTGSGHFSQPGGEDIISNN